MSPARQELLAREIVCSQVRLVGNPIFAALFAAGRGEATPRQVAELEELLRRRDVAGEVIPRTRESIRRDRVHAAAVGLMAARIAAHDPRSDLDIATDAEALVEAVDARLRMWAP